MRKLLSVFILFGTFFVLISSSIADIKDKFTESSTISAALEKAKKENKKVIVYFVISRDHVFMVDYDKILFSYADFKEALKKYVLVREWISRNKEKKYPRIREIIPRGYAFVFLDPTKPDLLPCASTGRLRF